ncbi:MAG: hypothetical protein E7672_07400 [Ruminococcaceae bacterium]|nr:hypothetical protein [Oscillospiraceae bacterium]
MKKILYVFLIISLFASFVSCSSNEQNETEPNEEQNEIQNDANNDQNEQPVESSDDSESENKDIDPHSEIPEQDSLNTVQISRPDIMIYSGPGYDHSNLGKLIDIGEYSITEESVDDEGFRWGKLESGEGWIDLSKAAEEAPHIPVTLEITNKETVTNSGMDCHLHIVDEADYMHWLLIQPYEQITDISFCFMTLGESRFVPGKELFTLAEANSEKPLVFGVIFYGDFTTFGLSFTDAAGDEHQYIIYTSGRNGSIIMQQYDPYVEPID